MTEAELLPCPFCGGEAMLGRTNSADERSGYVQTFTAYCTECSCMVARSSKTDKQGWADEGDESLKRRVHEAWNRRAAHPHPVQDGEGMRRTIAEMAWRFRGNDRLGGPWYVGAKPTDSPAMADCFGFADAILAALPAVGGGNE